MRTLVPFLALVISCSGPSEDGVSKAKLASDLTECRSQVSSLKEELVVTKAKLAAAEQAAAGVVKTDAVDVSVQTGVGVKHMEGNVPPDQVVKVVKQNSTGLRSCYERALKRKPDLQYVASLTAHFSIKNTGNATNVSFSPHADSELEKCMARTMEHWRFPTFQGDPVAFETPVNLIAK